MPASAKSETPDAFLGVLSGTSADGIDIGLVSFQPTPVLHAFTTFPMPEEITAVLHNLSGTRLNLAQLAPLQHSLTQAFIEAITHFLQRTDTPAPIAIGFHGQTQWHDPARQTSWQLGNPAVIAHQTGIPVIAGFRDSDLARNGEGAPLAPLFHKTLFADLPLPLAIVNIGGIANISLIRADGSVLGWDTGPGNGIMDEIAQRYFQRPYDLDGAIAARGQVDASLLSNCLSDPFFKAPPPKSTGREAFNLAWLLAHTDSLLSPEDLMATACALTAHTIAEAIHAEHPGQIILCGGGAHNPTLRQQLKQICPGLPIQLPEALGRGSADSLEAMLFAWLAWKRWHRQPVDYTRITGARSPGLYGTIWMP